ncbi:DinB family protein [Oryzobacter sp. R7]|uniref:DinB family protein n=1 Tax=Oryzobacter faecalis TaxID=3388656 RepID=UPI00398D0CCB
MSDDATPRLSLAGADLFEADLSGAVLRESDLRGTRIVGSLVDGLEITAFSGILGSITVEGVDVVPFVEAELDRRFPYRPLLRRATTADDLRATFAVVDALWVDLLERAADLPDPVRRRQVGGEWSLAQTVRHLVMATDIWVGRMLRGQEHPWHPIGQPVGDEPRESVLAMGVDPEADPPWEHVVEVWRTRRAMAAEEFAAATDDRLDDDITGSPTPAIGEETRSRRRCLLTIVREMGEHHRYATRDLALIEAGAPS